MDGGALDIIRTTLTGLGGDIATIIPVALGVAVIPFGAKKLWGVAKGFMGS